MKTFTNLLLTLIISVQSALASDFQVGITVKSIEKGAKTTLNKHHLAAIGEAAQDGVNIGLEKDNLDMVSFNDPGRNLRTSRELQCNMMACNYYSCQTFRHDHAICLWFCSSCSWYRRLASEPENTVDHKKQAKKLAGECADRILDHMKTNKYNKLQQEQIEGLVCTIELNTRPDEYGVSQKYVSAALVGDGEEVLSEKLEVNYDPLEVLVRSEIQANTIGLATIGDPDF